MGLRRRTVALLAVAAVVAVLVAAVVSTLPRVNDARDDAEARWRALRSPLAARYDRVERLAGVVASKREGLTLAEEANAAVDRWSRASAHVETGPKAANTAEGYLARLVGIIRSSSSLSADPAVTEALQRLAGTLPDDEIAAFNRAVEAHDGARGRFPGRWFTSLLGADALTTVDVPPAARNIPVRPG
ncbi:MAG TPA: hypothetical protein VM618_11790 [Acidimicrobiia bacterium]|nr:hypothetical protein [Acidimicrobiia bacterium]